MPYAPGVEYRGGELIAQGITSAANSLAQGYERRKQESQRAKALRGVVRAYQPDMATDHLSLGDLEGLVQQQAIQEAKRKQGLAEQMQAKQMALQQDRERWNQTMDHSNLTMDAEKQNQNAAYMGAQQQTMEDVRTRRQAEDARLGAFNQALGERFGPAGNEVATPPSLSEIVGLAARSGVLGHPEVDQTIRALGVAGRGADADNESLSPSFVEDPQTRNRFVTFGRQILPSGVTASASAPEVRSITGPNGEDLGNVQWNGKGWSPVKQAVRLPPGVQKVAVENMAQLSGALAAAKRPEDRASIQAEIDHWQQYLPEPATPRAAPAAPQADPANNAEAQRIKAEYQRNPTPANLEAARAKLRKLGFQ
jgi:hypothetical protein